MKTEQKVKNAITLIQIDDEQCPTTAHKEGRTCFDVGHAIRGTWISTLKWVLDQGEAPWKK